MKEARRPMFPNEVTRYYQEVAEEGRLAAGPSRLEFARTQEVLLRYLSAPPATILDARLVEEARRRSEAAPNRIGTCQVGTRGN